MTMLPVEALIRQIAALPPSGHLIVRYEELAEIFSEDPKQEIFDLAAECGCAIRDVPEYENVVLTKANRLF